MLISSITEAKLGVNWSARDGCPSRERCQVASTFSYVTIVKSFKVGHLVLILTKDEAKLSRTTAIANISLLPISLSHVLLAAPQAPSTKEQITSLLDQIVFPP